MLWNLSLVFLFLCQLYCFFKIFSNANKAYLRKYRWLGPFALIIPGALTHRGTIFLFLFVFFSAVLFVATALVFETSYKI